VQDGIQKMADPCYFHVDMDAFYASVEQADNPDLIGKPVIVGGTSGRGVVSACSYEARKFGIHSAMPIFQARKLCPDGCYLPVRMSRYLDMSRFIMDILKQHAPVIQQISVDEAFLDMTGTELLMGPPESSAGTIKSAIRNQTQLTISIGIGTSKFVAKMASAKSKPDGLFRVPPGREIDFIDSCRIKDIWGIGPKAETALASKGITSVKQLRSFDELTLKRLFGQSSGSFYYAVSRGIDPGIFTGETKSRSVSNELTLSEDVSDRETLRQLIFDLSHQVFFRTLSDSVTGKTSFIKIKYTDFSSVSAQKSNNSPFLSAEELFFAAWELFDKKWDRRPVRLIGVGIGSIEESGHAVQNELFDSGYARKHKLEKAVQTMQSSGIHLVKASSLLGRKNSSKRKP
jgi:DNA polymerase IV